MVVLNGNKNQKVIAYKGDREPVKVFYRPKFALTPVLQEDVSYKPKTSDTQDPSITYSSEYKKNLLNLSIKGGTHQSIAPMPEAPQEIKNSSNVSVELSGPNLLDINAVEAVTRATYEVKDNNTVVFTPTGDNASYRYHLKVDVGKRYTVSAENIVNNNAPQSILKAIWVGNTAKADVAEYGRAYVNQPFTFMTTSEDLYIKCYICYTKIEGKILTIVKPMVVEGTQVLPYQPYTEPTTVTTDLTLAENDVLTIDYINKTVGVARNTKVIELTGGESWIDNSFGGDYAYSLLLGTREEINFDFEKPYYCTHFSNETPQNKSPFFRVEEYSNAIYLNFYYVSQTSLTEWENWLSSQYSNGTPVIVQYSKSGIYIPDYLEVSESVKTELLNLPTTNGTNVISTDSDVSTSNINITYAIWGGADE